MKNTKKRGFTIVELVIVIAVIAILASVLIPTFTNVVNAANKSNALQEARNAWVEYVAKVISGEATDENVAEGKINAIEVTLNGNTYTFYTDGYSFNGAGDTAPNITGGTYTLTDGVFAKKSAPVAGGDNNPGGENPKQSTIAT